MKKAAKTVVLYGALQRKKAPKKKGFKKKVKQTLETTKKHLDDSGMHWHDVMHSLEWTGVRIVLMIFDTHR